MGKPIVIKAMKNEEQYLREVDEREALGEGAEKYVIPILYSTKSPPAPMEWADEV